MTDQDFSDANATPLEIAQRVLHEIQTVLAASGWERFTEPITQLTHTLQTDTFKILVMGEFNAGKSTLLNALLATDALPARMDPTTAVITRMVYGDPFEIRVVREGQLTPEIIDYDTFVSEFSLSDEDMTDEQVPSRFANIEYVEIQLAHPLLANGVTIVDSPGLNDQRNRTLLTVGYLQQVQAVVVMLTATRLLDENERRFIQVLGEGRLPHVFFVVNRINQVQPEDEPELWKRMESVLRPHFLDDNGQFDIGLFRQRVFFVNARAAQHARANPDQFGHLEAESRLRALEDALYEFLTGSQRLEAALHSTWYRLVDILYSVRQSMDYRLTTMRNPVQTLAERQKSLEARVHGLTQTQKAIERTIIGLGEKLKYQIYADLLNTINQMEATWPAEAPGRIRLPELDVRHMMELLNNGPERDRLAFQLGHDIHDYLEAKFGAWIGHLPDLIQGDLQQAAIEIGRQAEAYQAELSAIAAEFSGAPPSTEQQVFEQRQFINRLYQSLSLGDIAGQELMKGLPTGLDMGNVKGRTQKIGRAVMEGMIYGRLLGGVGALLGALVAGLRELLPGVRGSAQLKDRILATIGKQLFKDVRQSIIAQRDELMAYVEAEFTDLAAAVGAVLDKSREASVQEQNAILAKVDKHNFSIQEAEADLNDQFENLLVWLNRLSTLLFKRDFAFEDIRRLAQRRAAMLPDETGDLTLQVVIEPNAEVSDLAGKAAAPVQEDGAPTEDANLEPADLGKAVDDFVQIIATKFEGIWGVRARPASASNDDEIHHLSPRLAELIGLETVKRHVLTITQSQVEQHNRRKKGMGGNAEPPSLHLVFTGNPGTGKTEVAQAIGEIYARAGLLSKGHTVMLEANQLIGKYVGWTADQTRDFIEQARGGVLFIDEAYQLADTKRGGFVKDALDTILYWMDQYRRDLMVIVAGYPAEMEEFLDANPGLRRRFAETLHFPDYSPPELMQILQSFLKKGDYTLSPDATQKLQGVIEGMYDRRSVTFGNAGEMRKLSQKLIQRRDARVTQQRLVSTTPIELEDIPEDLLSFAYTTDSLEQALAELDKFIGLESVKSVVRQMVASTKYDQLFAEPAGERYVAPMHMAFIGNPGTGKTEVAKVMGRVLKSLGKLRSGHVVKVTAGDMVAGYRGQSAAQARVQIEKAVDGVLFIDEIQGLIFSEHEGADFLKAVVIELLKFMEEYSSRLCVIVAGYEHNVHAFLAADDGLPSRFVRFIEFPDYSSDELLEILRVMLKAQGGFRLAGGAEAEAYRYLMVLQRQPNFGNARAMRNLAGQLIEAGKARITQYIEQGKTEISKDESRLIIADDVLNLPPQPSSVEGKFGPTVFQIPDALDIELPSAAALRGR